MSGMQLSQEFKRRLVSGSLPDGIWASPPQRSDVTGRVVSKVRITSVVLRYDLGNTVAYMETLYRDMPVGRFEVHNIRTTDAVTFNCETMTGEQTIGLELTDVFLLY